MKDMFIVQDLCYIYLFFTWCNVTFENFEMCL